MEESGIGIPMSGLRELVRQTSPEKPVADVLADVFRKRIMDGEYLPGMRLVEAELTKNFGVSRGPVREAIRRLMSEGLVEAEKHRSPTVKGIDQAKFRQMFEVRAVLEAFAARLAAVKLRTNPDDVAWAETERSMWLEGHYGGSMQGFIDANTCFHDRILSIADHEVLTAQVRQLAIPGYKAVFKPLLRSEEVQESSRQHAQILDAILSGDGSEAERLMREHVSQSGIRISAKFSIELFDRRLRELERLKLE